MIEGRRGEARMEERRVHREEEGNGGWREEGGLRVVRVHRRGGGRPKGRQRGVSRSG
jgi:hypothetical protein